MSTITNFRNYALWFIIFFMISVILENALNLDVTVGDARATNMNGYMDIKVKNTTGHDIENCSIKLDLYSKSGNLVSTKYVDASGFKADETRAYKVKFTGNEIGSYGVTLVENAPDQTYVMNLFGFDIDLRNIFGRDFTKIIDLNNIKETGVNLGHLTVGFLKTIPTWAYVIAGGVVLWYLPGGYLFGILP